MKSARAMMTIRRSARWFSARAWSTRVLTRSSHVERLDDGEVAAPMGAWSKAWGSAVGSAGTSDVGLGLDTGHWCQVRAKGGRTEFAPFTPIEQDG